MQDGIRLAADRSSAHTSFPRRATASGNDRGHVHRDAEPFLAFIVGQRKP